MDVLIESIPVLYFYSACYFDYWTSLLLILSPDEICRVGCDAVWKEQGAYDRS